MIRTHKSAVLLALWTAILFLGCARPECSKQIGPTSVVRSEPVLQTEDDAKTAIEKAVKAHGGEKAFSCWRCGYVEYKTKGGFIPSQLGEVTNQDTFQLPGHFKRVTLVDAGGKELRMIFVVNNGKGWTKKGDGPAEPSDNDFTEKTEHPFAGFCNLAPLTDAEASLTKLPGEKVGGENTHGIRAKSDKLGQVDFYFGLRTGLLLKSRRSTPGTDPDKPGNMVTFLDDYKNVQGIQIPMRITGIKDGKPFLDVTLIQARLQENFEERIFGKP